MINGLLQNGLSLLFSLEDVGVFMWSFILKICIFLDGIVFNLIDVCYQVFIALARARIFNENTFSDILQRIYVLVGVIMLFFVVYSLLKVIANPDNLTKGDMAPGKLVGNVLTSIVLIALLPTIFKYVYQVQGVLLDQDIVGRIVMGEASSSAADTIVKSGRQMAVQVWNAFFYAANGDDSSVVGSGDMTLQQAKDSFVNDGALATGFRVFTEFSENAARDEVQYTPIVSFLCGAFCLWMIVSFIFDLGIRAVKLGVLQIIAPIPILMRVLPSKGKQFNTWVQTTVATFFEVFVRIFIVYIVAKILGMIGDIMGNIDASVGTLPFFVKGLTRVFLIMGVVAYAKQAPKMIGELLGIKSGNMKLGLRNKLQAGGGFVAGAAIGAGVTTGLRNTFNAAKNVKGAEGAGGKWHAGIRGAGSVIAGFTSGALRGGWQARAAKTEKDMANAIAGGTKGAVDARNDRTAYMQENSKYQRGAGGEYIYEKDASGNFVIDPTTGKHKRIENKDSEGNVAKGVAMAHLSDAWTSIKNYATGDDIKSLQDRRSRISAIKDAYHEVFSAIEADVEKNHDSYYYRGKSLTQYKNDYEAALEAVKNDPNGVSTYFDGSTGQYLTNRSYAEQLSRAYNHAKDEVIKIQNQRERGEISATDSTKIVNGFYDGKNKIEVDVDGSITEKKLGEVANLQVKINAANQKIQANRSELTSLAKEMLNNPNIDFKQEDYDQIMNSINTPNAIVDKKTRNSIGNIVNQMDIEIANRRQKEEKKDKK